MERFWGICALVLSTVLLSGSQAATIPGDEEADTSSSEIDFDTGFLIVAPKVFVADSVETICISLQNMTGPLEVAIRLMDNYTAMAKLPIQFMEFRMACYDIEVPAIEYEMMHATLMIKMRRTLVTQSGFEVVEKRTVTINGVNTEMFIETDKPVYKPGQTVKFRILNINQDLKPDVTPVSKIWIESPSGIRMQQWRNQESTDGLIDLEMPMTPDPVQGTWSIIATHKGRKTTRTFEVDEYVLPKFEIIVTPPTYVMINTTNIRVKICGRYTYGQPVRGSFEASITVKSTGWNFRERRTINKRVDDTGPSGCNEFPVDLTRLELNSTDFSLWNARLSVDVEYTEASTGVMLEANSESSQITRDALKLQFDSPNIFKPGVPYYGKIFVTHPDGSPAAGKLISLSCNTDQGQIFDKNLTSPENGAIEFTVTDINITATSLNLYAHAPGFNIPKRETYGREHAYTLHDPATSHYARPQYSPSGSFLQMAPIRGMAAVGSEQMLRIDFTANDPEENPRFRFVVMSRGNIIATRFYRAHKRPKRAAGDSPSESEPSMSEPSPDGGPSMDGSMDGVPSVMPSMGEMPSEMGSLDIPSFIPSVLGGSSFSSDFSFVPPTDAPVIIVEPGEVYSRELYFRVTPDMVPETRILAYYVRTDGEVVADSIAFRVQKKFENEVDIAFSDEERMPGAETQIMIHASPGSLCAVGVVDRSVHILGGDNQLKADKIFASLNKYQLTSAGGYIDASTHCVPEEDEYPQFFPLGRKKRGIFLPGYGSKYQDSSRAFKDMGLVFITNMDVETSPCVGTASLSKGTAEVENAAEGPVPVPLVNKEDAAFDDGGILEEQEVPSNVLETAPRIRSYFPETWLWDLRRTDSVTGETSISMEVPDTVTEWIGSGFCTSVEYGVGVSPPTKLRAFQPFFLSYTLPYSVVRGEVVPITVTVFNYLTESLVVEVSLELNEGYRMARKSRPRKKVCVGGSQSQSVEFRILPRKLGNIALQALGLSVNDQDALCGNELVSSSVGARDSIYKELLVEAEGTEVDTTQNCYFCPEEVAKGEYEKVFNVTLPASIVEGSARGKISITGDLMGPSLSNLDHLIRLPTGCGEQNMLGFVPNIVALSYLTTTDQLTPSVDNKAKFNMKRGYQRELNYRHRDGSYSAFGENDPEGSTWLTAFVVRSFAQAQDYIYIDEDDLKVSISWLKSLQSPETGCFQSRGKLCHKDMKGGINSERTLTSYVLITLLEAGLDLQDQVITDALRCVTNDLPEVEDTYALAQLAYALTLAESPLAQDVMDKLESMAVYEDGLKFWQTNRAKPNGTRDLYAYQAPSTDIEMTSYILLALIGRTSDITLALREGNPIARWIVLQRNSNGGFSSTQDTVVALHALAEFAKVAYSEGTSIKAFVEVSPLEESQEGPGELYPFTITSLNRLVLAEETLPVLPAQITLVASGSGCALMQISTTHNEIPESPEDAGFELDVLVLESYESSKNTRCSDYYMKVCARYTGSDEESNMAIVQVKMISGFYPDKESLRLLQKQHKPLQRYDVDNKNIYFYFNELTNEDTCLVFSVVKEIDVEDVKPGVVQVYDYYDKEINVKQLYDITCEDSPPSWDASLLYTIPVKPSENDEEFFGNDGDMRPLPFVLAALRRVDGLVVIDPPGESEGGSEGAGTSSSDGGEGEEPLEEVDPMDAARELGPPDVFILCPAGQKFVDGLKRCIPINGCESSPCLEGQNCIDTDAGYLCVGCKPGFRKGVADQCVRMSNPTVDLMLCGPGQEYVNGGCTTVDQCIGNPCPIGARCRSTAFGHTCEPVICPPGRELTPDLQCVDIDECLQNPCYEGELCINRALGYDCICAEGYERDEANYLCVDINECEREVEPCGGPEYTCMNDQGSYQCFCVEGYIMDLEGYCVPEVQATESATREPQEIGQETTSAPAQQDVTRESASEQSTEQPQEEVTKDTTSQPTTPSPVEEATTEEVSVQNVTQSSGQTTASVAVGTTDSVALNTREEPVTSDEPGTQSPGDVSATQSAAEDTTAPASGSVTSNADSDASTAGTKGVDPTTQDTQVETTAPSPVEEGTGDSGTPPRTSGPTVKGSSVTDDAGEGSATPGSLVTQDSAASGTTADSQATQRRTDSPTTEEAPTPSGNENTGTSAPAEQDTATTEETDRGSVTAETPERTTSDGIVTTDAVTPGAAQTTDEPGAATPSDVTDTPSNATEAQSNEVTGEVPMRGDGTVEQGGQGGGGDGDGDGDKPIIDYGGIKPGMCPVEDMGGFSICGGTPCRGDEDCPGTDKCCQRSCGKMCMVITREVEPVDPVPEGGIPPEVAVENPGSCPMDVGDAPMCTGITCTSDEDCHATEKCCFDFECGFASVCMPAPQIQPPVGPGGPVGPEVGGHPGVCPDEVGASPYCDGALCILDADCGPGEKCCAGSTCAEGFRCMPAPQIQPPMPGPEPRKGQCPLIAPGDLGNCEGQECIIDEDCFDNEKCCGSACGYHCTVALQVIEVLPELHLGTCPSVEAEGACGNPECTQDGDCAETEKCCGSSCGFHCTTPPIEITIGGGGPREQECMGDLVFDDCAVTCQLTCAEPEMRPCIKMCGIGCYCPNGMLRESLESDRCYADLSSCPPPVPGPEITSCTGDLIFNECGTACEQSCDHPEPMMCTRQCVPGCFCPRDMLRVSLDSDTCVHIAMDVAIDMNCPERPDPEPLPKLTQCTGDLIFDNCGTACEQSCDHPEPMMCTKQCVPGCFCPRDMLRVSLDSDTCVHIAMDVAIDMNCPEKSAPENLLKIITCPGDLIYNKCGSACEESCDNFGLICTEQCLPGCFCPYGKLRVSLDSDTCVSVVMDAPIDKNCPSKTEPEPLPEFNTCTGDLIYLECGTSCERTYDNYDLGMCISQCVPGCFCPKNEPEPIPEFITCPGDLIYNECGSACEESCDNFGLICTLQCVPGCFCPYGKLRVSLDSDTCVSVMMDEAIDMNCPSKNEPEPIPEFITCPGDLIYKECGTACEESCDNFGLICIEQCVPGCFCPSDMLRVSLDSDTCVHIAMDAAIDMNCPETADSRPCETERRMKMVESNGKDGIFLPQCTQDGYYAMEQCYEGNGSYCWCADPQTGKVIPDSEVHDVRADCDRFIPDPSLLNQCPEGKVFADGVKKCVYPEAECPGDYVMNECNSACPDFCGKEGGVCIEMCVSGCGCPAGTVMETEGSTTCIAAELCPACAEGYKQDEMLGCIVAKPCPEMVSDALEGGLLIGEFSPDCTEEGKYEVVQCSGSTGFCWCVDIETGVKKQGTDVRGTPDCTVIVIEPEPLGPECPGDHVMNECNSACPDFCGKEEGLACIAMCVSGCGCPDGTVMESEGSTTCITPEFCPMSCEGDLEYQRCGTACPAICNEEPAFLCTVQCVIGCQCPDGMHRVAGTSRCVPQAECPVECDEGYKHDEMLECVVAKPCPEMVADALEGGLLIGEFSPDCTDEGKYQEVQCSGSTGFCWCVDIETGVKKQGTDVRGTPDCTVVVPEPEPLTPECPGDHVMNECNSACPDFCGKEEGLACIAMCVSGCGCPAGTVMESEGSTTCITPELCPMTCEGDLEWNKCGTACPDMCNEEPAFFCTFQCVIECQCPEGMHRVAGTSRCVPQAECPVECDEGYKHDEMLECVVAKPCPEMVADALEGGLLIGEFSPDCTDEGKYQEVQCSGSTGFCWCVDVETGVKKQGTDVRGTPDCTAPVPTCDGDMTYQTCGTPCPEVCNAPAEICIFACSEGCQCPPGMYLVPGSDPARCVNFEDCPADTAACDNGMEFSLCGKSCPDYCGKPEGELCMSLCLPGCICPEGTILIDMETEMCVAPEDCPGDIMPVAPVSVYLREGFQCPPKQGRCPYGFSNSDIFSCTNDCEDDFDCEGDRKCCTHSCGSVCVYPDFPVPQPHPELFPPVPESPPAGGISVDMCPAQDAASCGVACSGDQDCASGELCCINNACEGSVCLPLVTEQMCTTRPCPVFEPKAPKDLNEKVCGSHSIFIVKLRSDGRAKILDNLKYYVNPHADPSKRPIISFVMDDVCNFQMTEERYILFMDGDTIEENDDLVIKKLTIDHRTLVIPLTGHLKNAVKDMRDSCPIA